MYVSPTPTDVPSDAVQPDGRGGAAEDIQHIMQYNLMIEVVVLRIYNIYNICV